MERMNRSGNCIFEFLVISLVVLVMTVILLGFVIRNGEREGFQVFRYNAKTFAINSIRDSDTTSGTVYLYEMIDKGLVSKIKNNFSGDKFCDIYESKVEFTNDGRLVTLSCGNYLIYRQDILDKDYDVYKISEWTSKKLSGKNVDEVVVYSINSNDNRIFGNYYEKDLFIKLVSNEYGNKYDSLEKIAEDYGVISKKMYRKRVLVDK